MNIRATVNKDGSVDLYGKQGGTWRFILFIKQSNGDPMDLTGWGARGQIRKTYSSDTVVKSFSCSVLSPSVEGKVQVELSATDTAAIPAGDSERSIDSTYVYDIEIYKDNEVFRIIGGKLYVNPEVTK